MDYEHFILTVAQRAGVDSQEAEAAARATLQALAERLSRESAQALAERLPSETREWLGKPKHSTAELFDADELVRRVAVLEQVDVETARRHALAVFYALGRALPPEGLADLATELGGDFRPLLLEARRRDPAEVMPAGEFWRRVAERGRLDPDGARRATEAVLETLAERITGGDVDELVVELPRDLRPPLDRGLARSHGQARAMSLDEFLRLVAEREGVSRDEAREHARAVFATLREAVADKEFRDVVGQLPKEFVELVPAR